MMGVVPRFSRTPGTIRNVGPDLDEHAQDIHEALAAGRSAWEESPHD